MRGRRSAPCSPRVPGATARRTNSRTVLHDRFGSRGTVPVVPDSATLRPIGARPGLLSYVHSTWTFRHLGLYLARLRLRAVGGGTILGPLWLLATPLLNAALFYVVFAGFLKVNDDVPHYPLFLLTGVLMYGFFRQGATTCAGALRAESDLVRTMPFPRLVPPVAFFLVEVGKMCWSLVVLLPLAALSVGVSWSWIFAVAGVLLLGLFTLGLGLVLARVAALLPDMLNVLPVMLRGLAFLSGVYFPLSIANLPEPWAALLQANPVAAGLEVIRAGFTGGAVPGASLLILSVSAVASVLVGSVIVWQGEPRYGK